VVGRYHPRCLPDRRRRRPPFEPAAGPRVSAFVRSGPPAHCGATPGRRGHLAMAEGGTVVLTEPCPHRVRRLGRGPETCPRRWSRPRPGRPSWPRPMTPAWARPADGRGRPSSTAATSACSRCD
jgi:hypothetical protein